MISKLNRLFLIIAGVFIFLAPIQAQTLYVNDSMKITFRTGPGNDRKITALLTIGQKVEALESADDWTLVQLPDGEKGWVLSQYLTPVVPCGIEIEKLKRDHQLLQSETAAYKDENSALKTELEDTSQELKSKTASLQTTQTQYDSLKKESANFIQLKTDHETTLGELSRVKKRADSLEKELTLALRTQHIKWFLSGAGILVFGMIIGFSSKREKRRSSLR